jgi:hypothetical protein
MTIPHRVCSLVFHLSDDARLSLALDMPAEIEAQEALIPIFNSVCRAAIVALGKAVEGPHNVEQSQGLHFNAEILIDGPNEWQGFSGPDDWQPVSFPVKDGPPR